MIVYIANPLYDAAFKRIMEEERITKTFLSAILQREVVSIKICQDGFRNIKSNSISIFKMGFVASIKNNENSNELTNIRLYKTWVDTDVLEPRQHLAWQRYIEEKNSDGIGNEEGRVKREEGKSNGISGSCEPKADSLFAKIEKEYLKLKAEAAGYPKGLSILTERKTGNVWYVPGGQSTIGILLKDANARYIFEDDQHSGSLAMSPEQILAKGKQVDVWAFKYFGGAPLSQAQLLQEYDGYKALAAFNRGNIYQVDTSTVPYFELTSFHPELLLREFIILAHGERFGKLRFYKK
jgi:hypothetical protein